MADAAASERWALALAGSLAAATALATSVFLDGLAEGVPSLIHGVGQAIVRGTPDEVAREGIDAVGTADKPIIVAGTVVISIVLGAALGAAAGRRRWAPILGMAVAAVAGFVATTWSTTAGAGGTAVAAVGSALAGIAAWATLRHFARPADQHPRPMIGLAATRRRFLTATALTAAGATAATLLGRRLQRTAAAEAARRGVVLPTPIDPAPSLAALDAARDIDGLTPLVTPNDDFYRIDEALIVPTVDLEGWRLTIGGMVDEPYTLSFDELLAEPMVERHLTLACVSNEVGGSLVGNARWLGVPLARLLERAGVHRTADQVVGRSVDGFTVGFPTAVARDGRDALVAVGMNGEPLPRRHGFPARLVVPGLFGYVSATKWLTEIRLTTFDAFDAYWIERGWAEEGPVKTQSRIDVPRGRVAAGTVAVAGVAWATHRGISAVEVRVDDGDWQPATLAEAISEDTWRQWHLTWEATQGRHVLEVRATDGDGAVQPAERTPVFPDGATGHHRISVDVE